MEPLLENLHEAVGDPIFIGLMSLVAVLLGIVVIPKTTDMMVNSAAGLAGKYLGRQHRTLVINCSTNNPEIVTMAVAFGFGKIGGIGTPLGSNLANIYLMFIVALGWVLISMRLRNPSAFRELCGMLAKERRLIAWHVIMSLSMFAVACFAFRELTGQFPIGGNGDAKPQEHPEYSGILAAIGLCAIGVGIFLWRDMILRKQRPELYDEIDESDHVPSWAIFATGTLGLLIACYAINVIFVATTEIYGNSLKMVLGANVFAVLHYFVGALVTSLPELNVAVKNYRRITSPDLNTALASATASNMSNLAIAACGCVVAALLLSVGWL